MNRAAGRLNSGLLRQSLRISVVMFVTAAIALWCDRTAYLWYPLNAALIVVDDNDELTLPAARGRIMGTILGGLLTFVVHTIASGWMAVLLTCLLCFPLLRLFRWQGGIVHRGEHRGDVSDDPQAHTAELGFCIQP
ncbi:hypothetical protein [Vulcanococcus sp.]|uniref:hypothetical protein n=1 Tax=Vulcanococcus sp. TaxID=2856995 RepID=UPI0037D9DC21